LPLANGNDWLMSMDIDEFDRQAAAIKKLTKKGAEIIASLKDYIVAEFSEDLIIEQNHSSPTRLWVNFYGVRFFFCVEMSWSASHLIGSIAANHISGDQYDGTPTSIHAVQFDALGNIDRRFTAAEFTAPFLADVFTKLQELHSAGVILKP
jgi:hypothetical protein